jgi:hypothetical protein
MREIDDAEYTQLMNMKGVLEKLNGNPKSRRDYQRALKTNFPEVVTDEDRLEEAPEVKRLAKLEDKLEKYLDAQDKKAQDDETRAAFNRLEGAGYTEEGIGKIKKLMVDRKIGDPEAAAALFDKVNKPVDIIPSGFQPTSWNFGPPAADADVDTKLLFENEDLWAEKEARKAFREG